MLGVALASDFPAPGQVFREYGASTDSPLQAERMAQLILDDQKRPRWVGGAVRCSLAKEPTSNSLTGPMLPVQQEQPQGRAES